MKFSLKSFIIAAFLIVDVAFALNEDGNNSETLKEVSSLSRSETNYLQNETETGWEDSGKFSLINFAFKA